MDKEAVNDTPAPYGVTGKAGRNPYTVPVVIFCACLILFPVFTVLYVAYEQRQNDAPICGIINAILAPAPPAGQQSANPARAYEQNLHNSVVAAQRRYRC